VVAGGCGSGAGSTAPADAENKDTMIVRSARMIGQPFPIVGTAAGARQACVAIETFNRNFLSAGPQGADIASAPRPP
jgi:hypothetical protein